MASYEPSCPNCFKCGTCRGDGTIYDTRMERGQVIKERVTCRTCGGAGGKRGAGTHNHP